LTGYALRFPAKFGIADFDFFYVLRGFLLGLPLVS
jgi:hypothetical protein